MVLVLVGFIMGASMGVCGYLPPRYMAGCSLGQAVGGLICCSTQVFCILLTLGSQDSAFVYFSAATLMLSLTLVAYIMMRQSVSLVPLLAPIARQNSITPFSNSEQVYSILLCHRLSSSTIRLWPTTACRSRSGTRACHIGTYF